MLLDDIENYCQKHKISESRFGQTVFGDSAFIRRLRQGSQPRPSTIETAYTFMGRPIPDNEALLKPQQSSASTVVRCNKVRSTMDELGCRNLLRSIIAYHRKHHPASDVAQLIA